MLLLCLLLAAVMFLAAFEEGLDFLFSGLFLVIPIVFLPYGAWEAARDRERHLTSLLSVSPLTQKERLAAQLGSLSSLLLVYLLVTLPFTYLVTRPAAQHAFRNVLPFFAWGLVIGLCAASLGLLIGHLSGARSRLALSGGFLVALGWLIAGLNTSSLWEVGGVGQRLGHLVPLAWGMHAKLTNAAMFDTSWPLLLARAVLFLLAVLGFLAVVACLLQDLDAWGVQTRFTRSRVLAWGLIPLLLSGAVIGWSYTPPATNPLEDAHTETSQDNLWIQAETFLEEGARDGQGTLQVSIAGEPNRTVSLSSLSLESDSARISPTEPLPTQLTLDTVVRDMEGVVGDRGEDIGVNHAQIPLEVDALHMQHWIDIKIGLTVDGHPVEFVDVEYRDYRFASRSSAAALAIPILAGFFGSRLLPGRWNAW